MSAKCFAPAWMGPGAIPPLPDGGDDAAASGRESGGPPLQLPAQVAPALDGGDEEVVVWSNWPAVLPLELWEQLFQYLDSVDLVRFSELCRGSHELAHVLRTAKALMKPALLACTTSRCRHVIGSWANLSFAYTPTTSSQAQVRFWRQLTKLCEFAGERLVAVNLPAELTDDAPDEFWAAVKCKVLHLELNAKVAAELRWHHEGRSNETHPNARIPLEGFGRLEGLALSTRNRTPLRFPLADGHLAHLHPNLRALSVSSIVLKEVDMLGLQRFARLHTLVLDEAGGHGGLKTLPPMPPSLTKCTIAQGAVLEDVTALKAVRSVCLKGCPLLAALPAFICLESIHLELCPKLTRAPAATDRAALLFTGIADLTPLAAVVDLELNSDLELTGIENLCNLRKLVAPWCLFRSMQLGSTERLDYVDLQYCFIGPAALPQFANVHTVLLGQCKGLSDASALTAVHTLELQKTAVTDVAAQKSTRRLNLAGTAVVDVSVLATLSSLSLRNCGKIVDVSALRGLHTLDLGFTNVSDASCLGRLHTLNLESTAVVDVSALGRVFALDLTNTAVADISGLGKVSELGLGRCFKIKKFEVLGRQSRLDLSYLDVTDDLVKRLGSVRVLNLSYCMAVTNLAPLKLCRELDITCCRGIKSVSDIQHIPRVSAASVGIEKHRHRKKRTKGYY